MGCLGEAESEFWPGKLFVCYKVKMDALSAFNASYGLMQGKDKTTAQEEYIM